MTKETNPQNFEKLNGVMGWTIALGYIIDALITNLMGITLPVSFILCLSDRSNLKKQAVWKNKPIAWGWCLIAPVYLYKRTKLLKESLVKFWVNLIVLFLVAIATIYTSTHMTSCLSQALPYFNNNEEIATQFCQCTMGNSPEECLQKILM